MIVTNLILFIVVSSVSSEIIISGIFHIKLRQFSCCFFLENDYKLLPPIFHIDPYDKCLQENKTFCIVSIKLNPIKNQNKTKIWKLIEVSNAKFRNKTH